MNTISNKSIVKDIILIIVSLIAGAVITFFVSRHYYKEASEDLIREANNLRHYNIKMLEAMEEAGFIKLSRDKEVSPVGIQKMLSGKGKIDPEIVRNFIKDNPEFLIGWFAENPQEAQTFIDKYKIDSK